MQRLQQQAHFQWQHKQDGTIDLKSTGDWTNDSLQQASKKLSQLSKKSHNQVIIWDVSKLNRVDSAGILLFIQNYDLFKSNHCKLTIIGAKPEHERMYPVYVKRLGSKISAYCIPIIGKGLWSTMYGYLALEPNLNTILGITFYKQGETPGLGSEVESKGFQNKIIGKEIWNSDDLVSIKILKLEPDADSPNIKHEIAGISGATKTGEGVMNLLLKALSTYIIVLTRKFMI